MYVLLATVLDILISAIFKLSPFFRHGVLSACSWNSGADLPANRRSSDKQFPGPIYSG